MALVNGGYLYCTDIKKILLKATEKIGYGHLKNSGERSRAILALFFLSPSKGIELRESVCG